MSIEKYEPYRGKHYVAGIQDCLTIVSQAYKELFEITLTNYARPTGWEDYPEFNFFERFYSREGFSNPTNNVNDLREGDALLMAVAGNFTNHCALYLGQGMILHHLTGQLSSIVPYTYQWQSRVKLVLRHKDREAKICRHGAQLLELLPPHLKLRLARRLEETDD